MGSWSIWHWLIVLVIVLVLFGGRGKIAQIMGDTAQGIKAFKKGIKEDKDKVETDTAGKVIDNSATQKDNVAS
ncbi:MAG TPA: twin-arginine translocase TatA/TatE family subunit [Dongiaceae bacterium]|jgi:sec-independent protein translocase protein TatA